MNQLINDVSDTSLWVAYYRAKETERVDALFRDPLAARLIGERGKLIADNMGVISPYVEFSVIIRTIIIDDFIQNLVRDGVDTVINLGAGLDTRPYRLNLPPELNWIEVDYPHVIERKNDLLKDAKLACKLSRVKLDLADDHQRKKFLSEYCSKSESVLVITEGVIPYLTPEQVTQLANDLRQQSQVHFWILEYYHSKVYRYLKASVRNKKMQNSPFQFYPNDWLDFFEKLGWTKKEIRYAGEVGHKHGRFMPSPWWAKILIRFAPKKVLQESMKLTGFLICQKK